jgi:hypothetical protein
MIEYHKKDYISDKTLQTKKSRVRYTYRTRDLAYVFF